MKEQYKQLCGMLDDMKDQISGYEELVNLSVTTTYNLSEDVKGKIIDLPQEKIQELTEEEIMNILGCETTEELLELKKHIHQEDKTNVEYGTYVIGAIKEQLDVLVSMRNEYIKMEKEKNEISKEYINYLNSPEYKKEREEKLKKLREDYEKETDPVAKYNMKKALDSIESISDLSFLFKGFNTRPEFEKKSIMDMMFDDKRANYMLERYFKKCKALKIRPLIFRELLNIEEKFLPEEYHVYNNLFLFFCLRYIAYSNTNISSECAYSTALISNLTKLKYEQFAIQEEKEYFIKTIMDVLDFFKDEYEKFDKENITHPKHPSRIQHDQEVKERHEQEQKEQSEAETTTTDEEEVVDAE